MSKDGNHTGLTDIPLTAQGEELARGAGRLVAVALIAHGHFLRILTAVHLRMFAKLFTKRSGRNKKKSLLRLLRSDFWLKWFSRPFPVAIFES